MSHSSPNAPEPTVLLVAAGERLAPALVERLGKHGVQVELASPHDVVTSAFVVAPDVIVLAGQAALAAGEEVLGQLARQPTTSSVPVILIADPSTATGRLEGFRHGLVAVIDRTASADEMARRIAELARELPERPGEAAGTLESASLDDVVALFAQSLRSGVLAVTGESGGAQVVLRPDRPLTEAIEDLVARLKPMVARGEKRVAYEFHETAPARLASLDLGEAEDRPLASLGGVRLLVIQANASRADLLAQELRAAGAVVAVADGTGAGLELAHDLGPDVVVIDGSGVDTWALEALRAIRRDPHLRAASLLVMDDKKLWRDVRRPNVALLSSKVDALLEPDRALTQRVKKTESVGMRLDALGPIRLLRALLRSELGLSVSIVHPRLVAHIDLADGLVVGASASLPQAPQSSLPQAPLAEGPAALASILGLTSGRAQITRAESPRATNIMAPIDAALAAAAREKPVVPPSLPPPSDPQRRVPEALRKPGVPLPRPVALVPARVPALDAPAAAPLVPAVPAVPALGGDLLAVVGRLEELVQHLKLAAPSLAPPAREPQPEAEREPARAPAHEPAKEPLAAAAEASSPRLQHADFAAEEETGTYSPAVMAQLRKRMRNSAPKLAAVEPNARPAPPPPMGRTVTGLPAPASPARPPPPGALSKGAPIKAPIPAPKKATLTFTAVRPPAASPVPSDARVEASQPKVAAVTAPPPASDAARVDGTPSSGTAPYRAVQEPSAATSRSSVAPPREPVAAPSFARRKATLVGLVSPVRASEGPIAPPVETPPLETHSVDAAPVDARPRAEDLASELAMSDAFEVEGSEPLDAPFDAPASPGPSFGSQPKSPPAPPAPLTSAPIASAPMTSAPMTSAPMTSAPIASAPMLPTPLVPAPLMVESAPPLLGPAPQALMPSAEPTPILGTALPPERMEPVAGRRGLFLGVALVVVLAVATGIGAALLFLGPSAPSAPVALPTTLPTVVPGTTPPGTPTGTTPPGTTPGTTPAGTPTGTPTGTTPTGTTPTGTAGSSAVPAGAWPADAPVEGTDAEFDLTRLGIEVRPSTSRSATSRRVNRLLGTAYRARGRGDLDDAERDYRAALSLDPENPRATSGLSLVAANRGDHPTALLFARRLARLRPTYPNNFVMLGDRYLGAGDAAAARRSYEHALTLEPGHDGATAALRALPR